MSHPGKRLKFPLLAAVVALSISGCATTKPWEREDLARPVMAIDADPHRVALRRHVRSIREGSIDASGRGGGGCGCN